MNYFDGQEAKVGDLLALVEHGDKGVIVADLEKKEFAPECDEAMWAHLNRGILVRLEDNMVVLIAEIAEDTFLISRG